MSNATLFVIALCVAPSPPALDPEDKVYWMEEKVMVRLIEQWHWKYRGGWGGSGPSWFYPANVEGVFIFVKGSHPGHPVPSRIWVTASGATPKGKNHDQYLKRVKKAIAPIDVRANSPERLNFATEIDLSRGVLLADLHARILKFARAIKPYAFSADAPK